MKTTILLNLVILLFASVAATAATHRIPDEYPTIQDAIDVAQAGDTIEVSSGTYTYYRNLTFKNDITLRGAGADSTIIRTIDRNGIYVRGVSNITISDLTVKDSGYINTEGGGISLQYCDNITIKNCNILNNYATNGAGIDVDYSSNILIKNCVVASNRAVNAGGAISVTHTGLTLQNVTMVDNTANWCGGLIAFHSTVVVRNSIIWGNRDNVYLRNSTLLAYFCDIGEAVSGSGNINQNPLFVGVGDYHLMPNSPCIDAGDPNYVAGRNETDIDSEPRVMNGMVDIGADEFFYEPEKLVGLEIIGPEQVRENCQAQYSAIAQYDKNSRRDMTDLALWWVEPDTIASIDENGLLTTEDINVPEDITIYAHYTEDDVTVEANMAVQVTLSQTLYVPADYQTIQAAIDAAKNCDTVVVADGIYTGEGNRDIDFKGKAITVRSESGPENCIIDCSTGRWDKHRGFNFHTREDRKSVLNGFTITNGHAPREQMGHRPYRGGGISCSSSSPMITNCIITGNSASHAGGGISCYHASPTVTNCTISGNSARLGGGVSCYWQSRPTITNCAISSNSAEGWPARGGGIFSYYTDLNIVNCTISGNKAVRDGGGIACEGDIGLVSNPKIFNCTITDNTAGNGGGGICCHSSKPKINNCTITGNSGADYGGGMWNGNSNPTVSNCILWGNTAPTGAQIYNDSVSSATVSYSDIESCGGSGAGWDPTCGIDGGNNIDANPCFVDVAGGDLHLQSNSSCIDAGDPNYIPELDETDLDGNPRVINGRIDMGAYETNYIQAAMKLTPQMLNCNSKGKYVKAHLTLPEGFLPQDVDVNAPAVAEPMGAESEYIKVLGAGAGPVRLEICFDREAFCETITETDEVEIIVIGSLTTSRYFYATDTIKIKP